jgi:hypothetical protein
MCYSNLLYILPRFGVLHQEKSGNPASKSSLSSFRKLLFFWTKAKQSKAKQSKAKQSKANQTKPNQTADALIANSLL